MYAYAALALMLAWYYVGKVHIALGASPHLLLVLAMLAVAMHVLRLSKPAV